MNAEKTINFIRDLKILFIDDDQNFSRPIALYINKHYGYSTKIITSAELAYEELGRSKYDIILLDYKLADRSGLEVLQWLGEKGMDTPVIMITGYGCEEVAVEAMKLGAYDYANKGHISFDYVPVLIHNTLERYHLRKQQNQHTQMISTLNDVVQTAVIRVNKSLSTLIEQLNALHKQSSSKSTAEKQVAEKAIADAEGEIRSIKETLSFLTNRVILNEQKRFLKDSQRLLS